MAIGTPSVCYQNRLPFAGGLATTTFSPTSNTTSGHRAILIGNSAQGNTGGPLTSISDSVGNTWSIDASVSSGSLYVFIASCQLATAITTSDTITLNRTQTGSANYDMFLIDVSGLATSSAFDKSTTGTGTGTSYSAGPTATLSQNDEIAFGAWGQGSTTTPSQTPGTNWTGLGHASTCTAVYQIVSATTALTASETSNSATWAGAIATYKGAAAGSPPSNTVAPAVTGTTTVGQTLTTTNGTWTDNGSPTFTYQWQDSADGSTGWANIASATSSTYSIASGEATKYIKCVVTDTDANGATAASSNVVGPVASAASSGSASGGVNFPTAFIINP